MTREKKGPALQNMVLHTKGQNEDPTSGTKTRRILLLSVSTLKNLAHRARKQQLNQKAIDVVFSPSTRWRQKPFRPLHKPLLEARLCIKSFFKNQFFKNCFSILVFIKMKIYPSHDLIQKFSLGPSLVIYYSVSHK